MKPAIVLHEVQKNFKIKHTHSMKETFIAKIRRKETTSDFHALDGISFDVAEGESVALLGRNGSGKSTTLKLVSGVMQPDSGWVRTRGRVAGLLEVGAGFHPDLTGRENVYLNAAILGMTREETDARFDDIVEFSEIGDFIDTEVKRYSSGMYSRLGFSVAVHTELDTLLVDEILSVGDAQFREKCTAKMLEMQDRGVTMFIVSHNAGQVRALCSRGILLQNGGVVFDGPIEEAIDRMKAAAPGEAPTRTAQFADVRLDSPFAPIAIWAFEQGIARGGKGSRFSPREPLTRAQLALFLHRLAQEPEPELPEESPFSDVSASDLSYPAILWLVQSGIASGLATLESDDAAAFGKASPVTRGELAALLHRYHARSPFGDSETRTGTTDLESRGDASPSAPGTTADQHAVDPDRFSDVAVGSDFYGEIQWLAAQGITLAGSDEGRRFAPEQAVTRQEATTALHALATR